MKPNRIGSDWSVELENNVIKVLRFQITITQSYYNRNDDERANRVARERERENMQKVHPTKTVIHYVQAINHSRNYYSLK